MSIGERIRFFRQLKGMSQQELGEKADFPESTARTRIAQYEAGTRTPKEDAITSLAYALGISCDALEAPNIDWEIGVMQTFFAIEDLYGLKIDKKDGDLVLSFDLNKNDKAKIMFGLLLIWFKQYDRYQKGEITKEEYDNWRYNSRFANEPYQSKELFLDEYIDTIKEAMWKALKDE